MIDNQLRQCYVVIAFLISTMILLIALLFFEYRFFCYQAQELVLLKTHYYNYINDVQKKGNNDTLDKDSIPLNEDVHDNNQVMTAEEILIAQASDDPDDDDDYMDDSFVVINRQPEYLKQSTVDYLQEEHLDYLMTSLDVDQWSVRENQKAIPRQEKKQAVVVSPEPARRNSSSLIAKKPIKDFGFAWPIDKDKFWLSSLFGPRKRTNGSWGFHHGIDMAAIKGTIVKSARAGQVTEARFQEGYGNTVVVQHTSDIKTRYAHLNTIRVTVGQIVKAGTIVGTVGETGFIRKKGKDGSHLHFEVYEQGKRINPLHCLSRID